MKATVWAVVTYHGSSGDDVLVFASCAEAEACVFEYAEPYWRVDDLGPMPRSYPELCKAWGDHDLTESFDSRWELEEREVEISGARSDCSSCLDGWIPGDGGIRRCPSCQRFESDDAARDHVANALRTLWAEYSRPDDPQSDDEVPAYLRRALREDENEIGGLPSA